MPDQQHITVAWGRDFGDVTPMRGVIVGGSGHELRVSVDVAPLEEDGRPYDVIEQSASGPMGIGANGDRETAGAEMMISDKIAASPVRASSEN